MTSPLRARQEAAPTPHFSAAALTSIVRVTAPAWRIGIQAPRMALELPVALKASKKRVAVEFVACRRMFYAH